MGTVTGSQLTAVTEELRERFPDTYALSRFSAVPASPDSQTSAGASWLGNIFDAFLGNVQEILESGYPEDTAQEIAEGAAEEPYTSVMWAVFTDLAAYNYDSGIGGLFDVNDLEKGARQLLYELGCDLSVSLLTEAQGILAELQEEEDEEDEDEAPAPAPPAAFPAGTPVLDGNGKPEVIWS